MLFCSWWCSIRVALRRLTGTSAQPWQLLQKHFCQMLRRWVTAPGLQLFVLLEVGSCWGREAFWWIITPMLLHPTIFQQKCFHPRSTPGTTLTHRVFSICRLWCDQVIRFWGSSGKADGWPEARRTSVSIRHSVYFNFCSLLLLMPVAITNTEGITDELPCNLARGISCSLTRRRTN